eukprot:CAMPEP_0178432012 /NCGR_PEP_ID=MMETSP0689_2-20121128/32158_1 /TAXON_ID=160604 /ORGANISM="Amphidinium massartii, Strain CS-259" /LENGTH=90 /DNA_ID=CAMNT_0020053971 /DNA_START=244 /DNA_END=513 /DNA_ORIENTATION=+
MSELEASSSLRNPSGLNCHTRGSGLCCLSTPSCKWKSVPSVGKLASPSKVQYTIVCAGRRRSLKCLHVEAEAAAATVLSPTQLAPAERLR